MIESKALHIQRINDEKTVLFEAGDKLRNSLQGFCKNYEINESVFCGKHQDGTSRKIEDLSLSDLAKVTSVILKIVE